MYAGLHFCHLFNTYLHTTTNQQEIQQTIDVSHITFYTHSVRHIKVLPKLVEQHIYVFTKDEILLAQNINNAKTFELKMVEIDLMMMITTPQHGKTSETWPKPY